MELTRIGFVGLGMMGLPMLENLAGRGTTLDLVAFDTADAPFEKLAQHPAWQKSLRRARRLADLEGCHAVITMLPDSAVTNAVVAGAGEARGLVDVLAGGAIVVDMGSSNPADTMALARRLGEAGIALVDAPVSGAVARARAGTLTIMTGGPEAARERVLPILRHMGGTIIATGDVGSAHAMKALNNYVYAAGLLATSEALLIAERMQLDLTKFAEVLNASSGRNVATETKLNQFIIPRTFAGGFALRLQAKDVTTASHLQALAGVRAPQLQLCKALWDEALVALEPGADNTEIYRFLERANAPDDEAHGDAGSTGTPLPS
ncbi:NAD(P)-dependent oxidoreductase [Burkholderia sp. WAC0059]|uniref:NAD(P)-dependent oxidoreductase n=1 Tax=Burkholderia sp. WAC0059 TaxID=2066022 RepID=UPI000C7F5AF1|nr:NAD(P)-dependent oxidoreductase [Burkholderia sp. WAC0059]PLZ04374.1 NAD(P)-dependent oxidoreductase [Burkholderia sp. WAC0059]